MTSQRAPTNPQPKTSAEIGEMMGTGRVLDAAIRRAVRRAIEARELRRKLQNPDALPTKTPRRRGPGRRASP